MDFRKERSLSLSLSLSLSAYKPRRHSVKKNEMKSARVKSKTFACDPRPAKPTSNRLRSEPLKPGIHKTNPCKKISLVCMKTE